MAEGAAGQLGRPPVDAPSDRAPVAIGRRPAQIHPREARNPTSAVGRMTIGQRSAAALAAVAALVLACSCGTAPPTRQATDPVPLVGAAVAALATASSFHVTGHGEPGHGPETLDLAVGLDGGGGVIREGGKTERVVAAKSDLYVDAPTDVWASLLDAAPDLDAALADKWVHADSSQGQFSSFTNVTTTTGVVGAIVGVGPSKAAKPTTFAGRRVMSVSDAVSPGEVLYLSEGGTPGIVGATSSRLGDVLIDQVGTAALPPVPPDSVDLGTVEARFPDALAPRMGPTSPPSVSGMPAVPCSGVLVVTFDGATVDPGSPEGLHGTVKNKTTATLSVAAVVLHVAYPSSSGAPDQPAAVASVDLPVGAPGLAPGASVTWDIDGPVVADASPIVPTVTPTGFLEADPTGAVPPVGDQRPLAEACSAASAAPRSAS